MNNFEDGILDNPLDPTSGDGRVKNRKRNTKSVLILFVVLAVLFLTVPFVYKYLIAVLGKWAITVLIMAVVYIPIILKMVSITVLEEKKNKLAYIDQIDNEVSTLATIWEVQAINLMDLEFDTGDPNDPTGNTEVETIGYIEYMNGVRRMAVRIVYGSMFNKTKGDVKTHFKVMEEFLNAIDDSGFMKDIHHDDVSSDDTESLQFYYEKASESGDEDYIKTFTRILDYSNYLTTVRSSSTETTILIDGWGPNKHLMQENIPGMLPILSGSKLIYEYYMLNEKEIYELIAHDNSVVSFNVSEINKNKYKGTTKLGNTAVIEVRDKEGNIKAQYNPAFDTKRKTSLKSISLGGNSSLQSSRELTPTEKLKMIEENRLKKLKNTNDKSEQSRYMITEKESIDFNKGNQDGDLFIKLVTEDTDEEVKLGKEVASSGEHNNYSRSEDRGDSEVD